MKIVPDQTLVLGMTTGIQGKVTATLAGISGDDLALGTLRPDHIDHSSRGLSLSKQSNPGVSAAYTTTTGFVLINHGSSDSSFTPAFQFDRSWAIVRSRLTLEILTGDISASGDDLVTLRPRIVCNGLGGGLQYPWNQGPGNTDGLRFGLSRHNPGQLPSSGASDAGLITYAEDRVIQHRNMTFSFMWPVQNSTPGPGNFAEIQEVYWDLGVAADSVTIGRYNLDLRIDLL